MADKNPQKRPGTAEAPAEAPADAPSGAGKSAWILWGVAAVLLVIVGWLLFKPAAGKVVDVSASQVQQLSSQGVAVIDVRTPAEYAAGHIPGAQDIPVDTFPSVMQNWDKAKPLVVYCQTGGRSAQAVADLKQLGWRGTVYHFSQGFQAWTGQVEQGASANGQANPPKLPHTAIPVMYEFFSSG